MTTYKYLCKKYNKKETKKLFKIMGLDKQHKVPTRGLRGSGNSTLLFCECILSDRELVFVEATSMLHIDIDKEPIDYRTVLYTKSDNELRQIRELLTTYNRHNIKG